MLRASFSALLSILAIAVAGCAGGSDGPALYPVKGKITKAATPLKGVTVMLVPVDPKNGTTVSATSAEDGAFEFITAQGKKGAAAGNYKAVLTMPATVDYANPKQPPKEDTTIPKVYSTAEMSPVTFEVKSSGENVLEIPLP